MKCFGCGMDGHMARNCPYSKKGRRGEEEARGRPQGPPPSTKMPTMGALSGEGDDTKTQLEQLGQRLQELERKFKQEGRTRLLNTVAAEPGAEDSHLGPSVTARVCVNGVPTQALIDMGSPATVASSFCWTFLSKRKQNNRLLQNGKWKPSRSSAHRHYC